MDRLSRAVEDLSKNSTEYVDLKIAEAKLKTVKGLSLTLSKLMWMILFGLILSIVLMSLGVSLVFTFGELMGGRYALGALLVALIFIALLAVLSFMRDSLFKNSFVPLFVKIFFGEDNGKD